MKHKSITRPQQNETGPKEESMKECKAKLAGERPKVHPQKHVNQKKKHQNPKKPNEEQTMEDRKKITSTPERKSKPTAK